MLSKAIIYPRVESIQTTVQKENNYDFEVIFRHSTWLRKKHTDGKWYLCLIITQDKYDKNNLQNIIDVVTSLHRFHVDMYRMLIGGIVGPECKTQDGTACFIEDEDLRDEFERVSSWL